MKLFISGPYTANTPELVQRNVDRAIGVANLLIRAGHMVICPHLSHYIHIMAPISYTRWLAHSLAQMELCEGVVTLTESFGANIELNLAVYHNIKQYRWENPGDREKLLCRVFLEGINPYPWEGSDVWWSLFQEGDMID